ncbi:replication initiator protein [Nocardia sp. NBC_00508]|uniref:replication initiator n=1 Tax=Nocardia sp. NBC_00508 TaxID=2975992 RepID=UPI002E8100F3|nr:replication initiator [Nocardia sp. NBC_00508]WUD65295.1 replication initiator protein [Nocardia sp. NBC_00508]
MTAANVTELPSPVTDGDGAAARETAADRRARLNVVELAYGLAEQHKVCRRPLVMLATDLDTHGSKYIGAPCKSTLACVCPACAERALRLRQQQAYEGWHMQEEPVTEKNPPTEQQTELLTARARLMQEYDLAREDGDTDAMDGIREVVADLDAELRETGIRGKLPALDPEPKKARKRSTRRRQEQPDLPRKKVAKTTIGRQYAGKYRPSLFVTLTLPSYGRVGPDGAPVNPDTYDYRQAARDIIHFSALFDRFMQNYRRASGRDVQYFATVEPQKRGAPHIHIGIRGTDPKELIRQLAAATYHQVWWPHFDQEVYSGGRMPYWDFTEHNAFVDPDTHEPVPTWREVLDHMDSVDELEPAHVVRFGQQVDVKGILGGTEEASRHIGYLTKYLTKSIGDVIEPQSQRAADHYDRLHAELAMTPCSPTCGLWFRYGVVPKGANAKTVPGLCKGKAHRRDTLGMRGRRVLVSRKWTGKDLADHKADRAEFVRQRLAEAGISREVISRLQITPAEPGDPNAPPREHLIMQMVAQKITQQAEYTRALLAEPPGERVPRETESIAAQQYSADNTAA